MNSLTGTDGLLAWRDGWMIRMKNVMEDVILERNKFKSAD
jgi:hypothetical protein